MGWHLLAWGVVGLFWVAWSLLCGMGLAVLSWPGWSQGVDWATQVSRIEIPQGWADWLGLGGVERLRELLVDYGPVIERAATWLPDLSGWVGVLLWIVWALGTLSLLALGGLSSGLIALARRHAPARVVQVAH